MDGEGSELFELKIAFLNNEASDILQKMQKITKMAFILDVTRKLLDYHKADLQQILFFYWILTQDSWGIRNDLELNDLVWKCFSIDKIRNLEKNITWDFSQVGKIPIFENMTLNNTRVNSIHPQSCIQIGRRVSEILKVPPKMNA